MIRLLYISQLAEPDLHDLSIYSGQSDGDDDAQWFVSRLRDVDRADFVDVQIARVCHGDEIPTAGSVDAAIIGGSYHMVGEQREWQQRVGNWLADAHTARTPLLGICGGHQLMADFFGAQVTRLPDAPWAGSYPVRRSEDGLAHWLFRDTDVETVFHFACEEHVSAAPAGSHVLALNATSPALALDYGNDWVSVQFHPEMTTEGFVRYWRVTDPSRIPAYRPTPRAPLLLRNFIDRVRWRKTASEG